MATVADARVMDTIQSFVAKHGLTATMKQVKAHIADNGIELSANQRGNLKTWCRDAVLAHQSAGAPAPPSKSRRSPSPSSQSAGSSSEEEDAGSAPSAVPSSKPARGKGKSSSKRSAKGKGSGDEDRQLTALKRFIQAARVGPTVWKDTKELSGAEKVATLSERLKAAGHSFAGTVPTSAEIEKAKAKALQAAELEGIDTANIVEGGRRRRRGAELLSYRDPSSSPERSSDDGGGKRRRPSPADDDDNSDEEYDEAEF